MFGPNIDINKIAVGRHSFRCYPRLVDGSRPVWLVLDKFQDRIIQLAKAEQELSRYNETYPNEPPLTETEYNSMLRTIRSLRSFELIRGRGLPMSYDNIERFMHL